MPRASCSGWVEAALGGEEVIETAQLPLVHDDPYRCAEDCVYYGC